MKPERCTRLATCIREECRHRVQSSGSLLRKREQMRYPWSGIVARGRTGKPGLSVTNGRFISRNSGVRQLQRSRGTSFRAAAARPSTANGQPFRILKTQRIQARAERLPGWRQTATNPCRTFPSRSPPCQSSPDQGTRFPPSTLSRRWPGHVPFTPASAPSTNLVEHRFAKLTRRNAQRYVHRPVADLGADIMSVNVARNEMPKPGEGQANRRDPCARQDVLAHAA